MHTASCGLKNGPSDLLLVLHFKACTSLAVKLASCTSGKTIDAGRQIQSLQKQFPDFYGPLKEAELVHSGKHGPVTTCLGQGYDMFLLSDSK